VIDDAFGHWLAGFIDGEGCFIVRKVSATSYYCGFSIELRLDDADIIREIHERTRIGTIKMRERPGPRGNDQPQISWNLQSTSDCFMLAQILDAHPLRAKKKRDYTIWRMALEEQTRHVNVDRRGHRRTKYASHVERMKQYRAALIAVRKYDGGHVMLPEQQEPAQLRLLIS
jgi:hypothetical protein